MQKFMLMLLVAVLVMASMASASIKWERAAVDGPGNWGDAANWDDGYVPGTQLDPPDLLDYDYAALGTMADAAEAQVTDAQSTGEYLRMGYGVDGAVLRVMNGGSLTQTFVAPQTRHWSAVGDDNAAHLIVEAGGSVDFNQHLWVGKDPGGVGTVDINGGYVSIGQMLGLGWSGGIGYLNVNDGGVLDLFQLHGDGSSSIKNGSILNITGTGKVLLPGDYTSVINAYVGNGTIYGNGVLGNIAIDVTDNVTTITAIDIDSNAPSVDAGPDMITWSGKGVTLDPNIVEAVGSDWTKLTYEWSANPNDGAKFSDPNEFAEAPTVTITKATDNPSIVSLTLAVNNEGRTDPPVTDTMTIDVYDDACLATKAAGQAVIDPTDVDGNCITNFDDFVVMATTWLDDYTLTGPVPQ